ncbi:DNA mismatch repair protein MutS [Methylolobus aquaticus]|nr:DNA mismatch repair protein MutS [Methylolobus aquaticus]
MSSASQPHYRTILQGDSKEPPRVPSATAGATGEAVLDEQTFRVIEIDELFAAVDHATTDIGSAVLYRSLSQPLTDSESVRFKQDSVREIEGNRQLKADLDTLLHQAHKRESDFYDLLFGRFLGMLGAPSHPREIAGFGYETYIKGTRFMLDLVEASARLPTPRSPYLHGLVDTLRGFAKTRSYALMRGPVYRSEKRLMTREEKGLLTPAIKFRPTLFKPVGLTVAFAILVLIFQFVPFALEMAASITPVFWLFLLPLSLVYIPIVGGFDRDGCIYPLRETFKKCEDVQRTLDALGQLDELMGFCRYREAFVHPTCLPTIDASAECHRLTVAKARNPVLAKEDPAYVANDLSLDEERLTFVTGPNSGGKTAFCKTLAQIQVLAQIGCYIPAERATLTVADRIFYQVPEISHLTDGEGRFGTELKRTKAIFLAATSRSLVIMDELSEGTTNEEKLEISVNILDGFKEKGNSTVLITHNHELVDFYQRRGVGQARQVEFRNELPTYRLIEGISRVSHADRIAKKIGFSKDDIAKYLTGNA